MQQDLESFGTRFSRPYKASESFLLIGSRKMVNREYRIESNDIFNVGLEKNNVSMTIQYTYCTGGKENREQLIEFNIPHLEDVENFGF